MKNLPERGKQLLQEFPRSKNAKVKKGATKLTRSKMKLRTEPVFERMREKEDSRIDKPAKKGGKQL